MISETTAILFPGQGAQDREMLKSIAHLPTFAQRYAPVTEILEHSPLEKMTEDPAYGIHRNLHSSLLTILASVVLLDHYLEHISPSFSAAAGYSVGQWTAMYASGMLEYGELLRLVAGRASIMDRCCERHPGCMLAVIGLSAQKIGELLQTSGNRDATISNFNCFGQYTLSGTPEGIARIEVLLQQEQPKKLLRLPLAGAWHSPLMQESAAEFANFLDGFAFAPPAKPVIDNVTGTELPAAAPDLHRQLARHLWQPVQWEKSIEGLLQRGVGKFYEVGYGNMLSKFGFFISRHASFLPCGSGPLLKQAG